MYMAYNVYVDAIGRQNTPHAAAAEGAGVCVRAAYRIAGGEMDMHSTLMQRALLQR